MEQPIEVTLILRHGCCLCDEMQAVVQTVLGEEPARLQIRDVGENEQMLRLYGDQVPVLLINGRKAFKFKVTERELRRRLRSERWRGALRRLRQSLGG